MKGILYPAINVRDLPPLTEEEKKTIPALMGENAGKFFDKLILEAITDHKKNP